MFTYCFNNDFIFISLLCILYFYDDECCKMNFPVRNNKVLLYCIVLYCIVFIVLCCVVLCCVVLCCVVLCCVVLCCVVLCCVVLCCVVLCCVVLCCVVLYSNRSLFHIAQFPDVKTCSKVLKGIPRQ